MQLILKYIETFEKIFEKQNTPNHNFLTYTQQKTKRLLLRN